MTNEIQAVINLIDERILVQYGKETGPMQTAVIDVLEEVRNEVVLISLSPKPKQ